jgi:hypothetical protein
MEFFDLDIPDTFGQLNLPYEQIILAPIGDVHVGARGFARNSFKEYLKILDNEYNNVYYVGMGDYIDATRTTVRKAFKTLEVDDGEFVDNYVEEQRQDFFDLVRHTKGKWLGLLEGNHTWEYRDGTTTESRLCQDLEARFLHDCADISIKFQREDENGIRGSVGVWLHHGVGGRKFPVGKLLDHVCPYFPDSDIFLMGHTHVSEFRNVVRMHRVGNKYIQRTSVAAITGGWLKGYIDGPSTYVERKAYSPLAVGSIIIKVRPYLKHGYFVPKIRVESL